MNNVTPSPRTVLVVESNELTLELLHDQLVEVGFATTAVGCGRTALTMLAEQCFDVLIVDVRLPDMNGLSVCEAARERYQERIAILVLSDQEIERWGVAALDLCADDFLGKPFHLDELIARIESKLRRAPKG